MPRYDFKCDPCDLVVETVTHKPPKHHCGARLRRLYAPPAIAFKGPGFYTTDK